MNKITLSPGCYTLPLGSDLLWWLTQHLTEIISQKDITVILPTQRAVDRLKRLLYKKSPSTKMTIISYEDMIPSSQKTLPSPDILWEICSDPEFMKTHFHSLTPSLDQLEYWISTFISTLGELYAHEVNPSMLSLLHPHLHLLFESYEKAASLKNEMHPTKAFVKNFTLFQETISNLNTSVYLVIDGYIPPKLQEIAVELCQNHHVLVYGDFIEPKPFHNAVSCYVTLQKRLEKARITPQSLSVYAHRQPLIEHLQHTIFKSKNLAKFFESITVFESSDDVSLAQEILTLSKDLFKQGKLSVTIVTPNRKLAQYIEMTASAAQIPVDDSCGAFLSKTALGHILLNFFKWIENPENYKQLLNFIGHPLFKTYWENLPSNLDAWGRSQGVSFSGALSTYVPISQQENQRLSDLLAFTRTTWSQNLQERLNAIWLQLKAWGLDLTTFPEYPYILKNIEGIKSFNLLELILKTTTFRLPTPTGQHIRILGPLEIRLLQPETIIIAGMNEGDWPLPHSSNPWLTSKLREDLGLPQNHQISTLTSKIFLSLLGCKNVYLCRTTHSNGQVLQPSRWWERLRVLGNLNKATISQLKPNVRPPKKTSVHLPFNIPHNLLPKRLSISDLTLWINDPTAFLLKSVFKLNELPAWEEAADHRDKGIIIHEILEASVQKSLSFDTILKLMSSKLDLLNLSSHERMFWESDIRKCLENFQALHADTNFSHIWTEIKGEWIINTACGPITLIGKADRIQQMEDGSIHIIDYKTGSPPPKSNIYKGLAPQLPILGLMVQNGAFPNIPSTSPFMVSYWNLKEGSTSNFLFEEISHLKETFVTALERLLDPNAVFELNS